MADNSDLSWAKWGREDPYFGVLADDKFHRENLNDERLSEFFETGRIHIERVLAITLDRCGPMASQKLALDFGCGVGRLVIPLARVFEKVVGVDISPAMLDAAAQNCSENGIHNASFVQSDDELTRVAERFDFIHCYLVLQHIPVRRGEKIITHLLERLNDEGILAIHFPITRNASSIRKSVHFLRRRFPLLSVLINVARGHRWDTPFMQMNIYEMNRILVLLSDHGIKDVCSEVLNDAGDGGFVSAFIFVKKPKSLQTHSRNASMVS